MRKDIKQSTRFAGVLLVFLMNIAAAYSQITEAELHQVNTSYALRYLQEAAVRYADGNYKETLDYVEKGLSYDASFADFFYLKAQCLLRLNATRADCVEAAEQAVTSGLNHRIFSEDDMILLLSRLYTETKRYTQALSLLETLTFSSADSDFYSAVALYGVQRDEQAREVIEASLTRWSFDVRFPKLFFLQERTKPITRSGKNLAGTLLQQLYVWIEKDPSLAVYAAPFDPNPQENHRRLKVYRNMHTADDRELDAQTRLAAILAELRYGVIDEKVAVKEFFAVKTADPLSIYEKIPVSVMYSDQLIELCHITGMVSVRKSISEQLKTFTGVMLEDNNHDGLSSAAVFFENGRPVSAFFDPNQDEEYDYQVICNFGTPDRIFTLKNGYHVQYDSYPAVHSITQKTKKQEYMMRPLALKWEPVNQIELDLRLRDTDSEAPAFFTLRLRDSARLLQEHDFIFSALYCEEPSLSEKGTMVRTHFEKGQIISAETKKGAETISFAQYRNGIIVQKKVDYDGDGFFELLEQYDRQGMIERISVDINKNKLFEYYELYKTDGTIIKNWDANEDGSPEIQYTLFQSGDATTVWKHRYSGKQVTVYYKKGTPERLTIGARNVSLIKERSHELYWLEMRPSFSDKIAQKITELLEQNTSEVESCTVMIGNYELYAVRSGGAIFVQLFPVPAEIEARK